MPARTHIGGWVLLAAILVFETSVSVSRADVVLDGTLGGSGALAGPDFVIDALDGRTIGSNLFHSFSAFNLTSTQSATFTNGTPAIINNVLGRITDTNPSSIDGRIASTIPNASLFLMNPHGILFGPHATLDVPGAFHATTADYIGLADGTRFNAIPSGADALLTTAPPAAFGFLSENPAPISLDGSVLEVPTDETLSLIGGDIGIAGSSATLRAPSGRISLSSVASPGEVSSEPETFMGDSFAQLGSVSITGGAFIDVAGDPGGTVYIRGGQFTLNESDITAATTGAVDHPGIGVDVQVRGDIALTATDGFFEIASSSRDAGRAGDIRIRASRLRMSGNSDFGGNIGSRVFAAGDGGNVWISADSVLLENFLAISTQVFGSGRGGNITIKTGDLDVLGPQAATFISTSTFNTGDAGNLDVIADKVLLRGGAGFAGLATQVSSQAEATAAGGDLRLTAASVQVLDGAQINAGIFSGAGHAGNIEVTAETALIAGLDANGFPAGIFSNVSGFTTTGNGGEIVIKTRSLRVGDGGQVSVFSGSPGDSGNIDVHTENLDVTNGAFLITSNFGLGAAGTIKIVANHVRLAGPSPDGGSTGLFSVGGAFALEAGDVRLATIGLEVLDGSQISSQTAGPGAGGIIDITADSVVIAGEDLVNSMPARIDARTFVFGDFGDNATGQGGNIRIETKDLSVRNKGEITALSSSAGDGGNIELLTTNATISGDSTVSASTFGDGDGGTIALTGNLVEILNGASVTADSEGIGLTGNINIMAGGSIVMDNGTVSTRAVTSDGGNIKLGAPAIIQLTDSTVSTSVASGVGAGGNIIVDPQFVILNNSRISANAFGGPGGNIRIVAGNFIPSADSSVTASSALGIAGTIVVESPENDIAGSISQLPQSFLDASAFLPQRCAARRAGGQSSFVVARRGGVEINPDGYLPSFHAAGAPADSAHGAAATTGNNILEDSELALASWGCR